MILSGREGEKEEVSRARAAYLKDGDAKTALKLMPMWATAERSILHVLSKKQQDGKSSGHQGEVLGAALMAVPRTLRMMYLHAYQSYLWNLAASHRVRTYGVDAVVAGDLVLVDSEHYGAQSSTLDPFARSSNLLPSNDIMDPGGLTSNPSTIPDNADSGTIAAVAACVDDADAASALTSKQRLSSVHVVTPEEVEQGRWSITDVVLPVPGNKVQYPAHATAQVYAEAARQDGILLPGLHVVSTDLSCTHQVLREEVMSIGVVPLADSMVSEDKAPDEVAAVNADSDYDMASEMLKTTPRSQLLVPPAAGALPQVPKAVAAEFSFAALTGDYRHVIVKPKAFEWKLLRYSDPNDDTLVATDLEQLQASSAFSSKKVCNVDRVTASLSSDAVMSGGNKHAPRINAAALNGCRSIVDITDAENIIATTDGGLSSGLQTDSATNESAQSASALELPRFLGLQLRFQLPSSTYATMLIRELTKESTSKDFQAALSNAGSCQKK
ncbi:hypothetical protein CEUSTIGMA_g4809.t1 [Chlamydomonas eustigma]|uniref:TRUD domain-containing protein n=1 Tax=Chlamydomonas eustigma TaxID=1157962 RepID=A0A250X2P9_9CHLO|nr:hypothetical protein CEUSTIGMA_g4809.t1 [Chlamydomonas eustigma]|eukprot:GAX77363.1 hypothetical protein CEUSTIGMA_g4809.t1 [Chlamydomonas eustigma]